jgi:COP9 signalosome complex subunit 4
LNALLRNLLIEIFTLTYEDGLYCSEQNESKSEQLQVYYKVCYARVLDFRRKFIEAAQRYNELSYRTLITEAERINALRNALICTVLAPAGQQRSRMLGTLFKDERCQNLPAFSILEKMYLERIIRKTELKEFEDLLIPHQKALTADGKVYICLVEYRVAFVY